MRDYPIQPSGPLWSQLKVQAREMRHAPTEAEAALWQHIRDRQLKGYKFRRQHAINHFIVDFYCRDANLVVEVDGPIHLQQAEEDRNRQDNLSLLGFQVIRFTNEQVLSNVRSVLEEIARYLT